MKTQILEALRSHVESYSTTADGESWGTVYLDNARPAGMNRHAFAAYLSQLKKDGLYRDFDDRDFKGFFGEVKL